VNTAKLDPDCYEMMKRSQPIPVADVESEFGVIGFPRECARV